jgi:hypothetical protein
MGVGSQRHASIIMFLELFSKQEAYVFLKIASSLLKFWYTSEGKLWKLNQRTIQY